MYETKYEYRRVKGETPGKHGAKDYRASINDYTPKDGEILALVGFKLLAEDRYDDEDELGRMFFIRRLHTLMYECLTPEQVIKFAKEVDESK